MTAVSVSGLREALLLHQAVKACGETGLEIDESSWDGDWYVSSGDNYARGYSLAVAVESLLGALGVVPVTLPDQEVVTEEESRLVWDPPCADRQDLADTIQRLRDLFARDPLLVAALLTGEDNQ